MNVTFRHMVLMLAATLWISCGGSGDEPGGSPMPQPKDTPIAFSGNLAEKKSESHDGTRATTNALSDTHERFYAWAYKNTQSSTTEIVMQDYTVNWLSGSAGTTTSNSSGWEYVNQQESDPVQSIKYWDFDAVDYRFFGYAGPKTSGTYPDYSCTTGSSDVTISFKVDVSKVVTGNPLKDPVSLALKDGSTPLPLFSKLWYKGNSSLTAQRNSPVTLEFLQPYVKVRFMFRQSESETTKFLLSDMSFRPTPPTGSGVQKTIATAGTFTVTYPKSGSTEERWSVSNVTATLNPVVSGTYKGFTQDYYVAAADATADVKAGEKMWYVVIPAKDQGTYTLSVKVNGKEKSVDVPAQYMEWQPSYEYTYIFKITEAGGVEIDAVQSAFTPWVSHEYRDNDENPDMYEVHNW